MTTTTKRWAAEAILKRAKQLGIDILLVDDNLELRAAPGVLSEKATAIFKEYKQDIIDHLRSQYSQLLLNAPTTCATCGFNMNIRDDTIQFYYDAAGQCFCETCWTGPLPDTQMRDQDGRVVPARPLAPQERVMARARLIADAWPSGIREMSDVVPRITLKEHMAKQRPQQRMLAR